MKSRLDVTDASFLILFSVPPARYAASNSWANQESRRPYTSGGASPDGDHRRSAYLHGNAASEPSEEQNMSGDTKTGYAMKREVELSCDEAEERVRETLQAEGFGVLTRIDLATVFQEKLGADLQPYRILGACNPNLAYSAITAENDIGLLLPCNVIVYQGPSPSTSVIAAIDPVVQFGIVGRDDLRAVAEEVKTRLARALEAV
jgi:uncharacterized protein (DUF302 family)